MGKYYEIYREGLVDWLKEFAEKEAHKYANISLDEENYLSKIKEVTSKNNKKLSIEAKIEDLKNRVGLNLLESLEKEGNNSEIKSASFQFPLSIRHKYASDVNSNPQQKLQQIKEYIYNILLNRNGNIIFPALLENLEKFLGIDKSWIQKNEDQIHNLYTSLKKDFEPIVYNEIEPSELARADEPKKEDREPPLFTNKSYGINVE